MSGSTVSVYLLIQCNHLNFFEFLKYSSIVYLIAPSSTADIQLIFTLGTGTAQDRSWKIRTSLLACSSTSLLGISFIRSFIYCYLFFKNIWQLRKIASNISRKTAARSDRLIGVKCHRPQQRHVN